MEIGSLVKCVKDITANPKSMEVITFYGLKYPVQEEIYTVREVNGIYIKLEEVVNMPIENERNNSSSGYCEPEWNRQGFREVQPPMDIAALVEECMCRVIDCEMV